LQAPIDLSGFALDRRLDKDVVDGPDRGVLRDQRNEVWARHHAFRLVAPPAGDDDEATAERARIEVLQNREPIRFMYRHVAFAVVAAAALRSLLRACMR
jgi:hypothetical protein